MKLRATIRIRLQGAALIILAYIALKANIGGATFFFAVLGVPMLFYNANILSHCLYKASKRIYRKYRWTEIRNK